MFCQNSYAIRPFTWFCIIVSVSIFGAILPVYAVESSESLQPVDVTEFLIEPEVSSKIQWDVNGDYDSVDCQIVNYELKTLGRYSLKINKQSRRVTLPVQLSRGFYEIQFPELNQTFGVISIEPAKDHQDR